MGVRSASRSVRQSFNVFFVHIVVIANKLLKKKTVESQVIGDVTMLMYWWSL